MPKNFPIDEFDDLPPHGGRHRVRRTNRDRFREFMKVLVVTGALASISLVSLQAIQNGFKFDATVIPGQSQNNTAVSGPGVTILDGTSAAGLASKVAYKLLADGYNVLTDDNLDSSVSHTVVYINSKEYQAVADALAKQLGGYPVKLANSYVDPITVVLGRDYK